MGVAHVLSAFAFLGVYYLFVQQKPVGPTNHSLIQPSKGTLPGPFNPMVIAHVLHASSGQLSSHKLIEANHLEEDAKDGCRTCPINFRVFGSLQPIRTEHRSVGPRNYSLIRPSKETLAGPFNPMVIAHVLLASSGQLSLRKLIVTNYLEDDTQDGCRTCLISFCVFGSLLPIRTAKARWADEPFPDSTLNGNFARSLQPNGHRPCLARFQRATFFA